MLTYHTGLFYSAAFSLYIFVIIADPGLVNFAVLCWILSHTAHCLQDNPEAPVHTVLLPVVKPKHAKFFGYIEECLQAL